MDQSRSCASSPRRHPRLSPDRARVFVWALVVSLCGLGTVSADPLRIATYDAELTRKGPGLALRDILEQDEQPEAVARVVAQVAPDILLLTGLDWDPDGHALSALADRIAAQGHPMPHRLALRPNTGRAAGLDLNANGRLGEGEDSLGYGLFAGQNAMALLSVFPIGPAGDLSGVLWRDLPGALLHEDTSPEIAAVQPLSTVGHWIVSIEASSGPVTLAAFRATPPVFDGPEDRNGRRNHDEAALWRLWLDGALRDHPPPEDPIVLLGNANLDPVDGDGRPEALTALLSHPRLQDPAPESPGGRAAAAQGGTNNLHRGNPARDTADWSEKTARDPGNLRVDYVLPDARFTVRGSGVLWPDTAPIMGVSADTAETASRHRLVWVDVAQ